ncbi:uncharacterized protein G2W53_006077 [Senna tora]|uniref:Uncharacterized protein n=1 Tax=Senna tora TaxID=362788 RepID=A0A834X4H4_9FABA|nr:uncharacterized protein G2W53_006077 [Senna tora]
MREMKEGSVVQKKRRQWEKTEAITSLITQIEGNE